MLRTAVFCFVVVLAMAACGSDPTAARAPAGNQGIVAGTLNVRAENRQLVLRNTTERVVGYLAIEANQALVAMIPPCVGDQCKTLVQGAEVRIPYEQIAGYTASAREAYVVWWRYEPGPDGKPTVPQMEQVKVRL